MSDSDKPPIRIEGLSVRYGSVTACAGVSLSVAPGSVYALLGRNGAGKSSLIRCLLGQQKPSEGCAFLFDRDSWTSRERAMEKTGVAPEEPNAPPSMTAAQLSDFCRRIYPRWDGAGVSARLEAARRPRGHPLRAPVQGTEGPGHARARAGSLAAAPGSR